MTKDGLTSRQEKFAQGIAKGLTQADAYRGAYPKSRKWKADSLYVKGSALASKDKVAVRIEALRSAASKRTEYEIEHALADCDKAMLLATRFKSASAFVAATHLKAKLKGLLVEDRRNDRAPLQGLTDEQLEHFSTRLDDRATAVTGQGPAEAGARTTH